MTDAADATGRARAVIAPVVEAAGLVCEDVDVRPRGGRPLVTVVVDLPEDETGSVDLDAVAAVSHEISDALDRHDPLPEAPAYDLEVTTPGAERTLTEPRHFRRSRGRLLAIRTDDGRDLTARLLDVADDAVATLAPQDPPGSKPRARTKPRADIELPLDRIERATVILEFSPPGGTGIENDTSED
ncbi:ribosome maturation factor RimP [Brachybacterium huguangmaarense]